MVTLEQISVALEHPFVLLMIGAGVSGGLVTLLTHWLERCRSKQQNALEDLRKDREIEVERKRKELEIKVDIVSKMSELIAHQMANAYIAFQIKKSRSMMLTKMRIIRI